MGINVTLVLLFTQVANKILQKLQKQMEMEIFFYNKNKDHGIQ